MRTTEDIERAFKAQLLETTKDLVTNEALSLGEKLAAIRQALNLNQSRITALREYRARATDEATFRRIDRFIALRERATGYLVATSKWLVYAESHQPAGRERNYAGWLNLNEPLRRSAGEEIPFMEFSS